jgi:hypothetical protein
MCAPTQQRRGRERGRRPGRAGAQLWRGERRQEEREWEWEAKAEAQIEKGRERASLCLVPGRKSLAGTGANCRAGSQSPVCVAPCNPEFSLVLRIAWIESTIFKPSSVTSLRARLKSLW